jgi:hypothetical protein
MEKVAEEIDDRSSAIKSFSQSVEASPPSPKQSDENTAHLSERRPIDVRIERAPEKLDAQASASFAPIKPAVQVAQTITIAQTHFIDRSVEASAQRETAATKSEGVQTISPQAVVVKPEVTANTADAVLVEPQLIAPKPEPSVKITIGRIDVRAVMPATPSTVTAPRPPAMKALSLDEYLQQRNGEHG